MGIMVGLYSCFNRRQLLVASPCWKYNLWYLKSILEVMLNVDLII